MNNLLSYCGFVYTRISASEKDLPVTCFVISVYFIYDSINNDCYDREEIIRFDYIAA